MSFFANMRAEIAQLTVPESVVTIDMITDFFQDGDMWVRDTYQAPNGARCLAAAASAVKVSHLDSAKFWLMKAINELEPQMTRIEDFNDSRRSYDEVKGVLVRAREMALEARMLPAPQPVRALPAPIYGEILPPVREGSNVPAVREVAPVPAVREVSPADRVGRYRPGLTAAAAVATAGVLAAFLNE
jgi:hypothetical protein